MTHWDAVWISFALTILALVCDFLLIWQHRKQLKRLHLFAQLDQALTSTERE